MNSAPGAPGPSDGMVATRHGHLVPDGPYRSAGRSAIGIGTTVRVERWVTKAPGVP